MKKKTEKKVVFIATCIVAFIVVALLINEYIVYSSPLEKKKNPKIEDQILEQLRNSDETIIIQAQSKDYILFGIKNTIGLKKDFYINPKCNGELVEDSTQKIVMGRNQSKVGFISLKNIEPGEYNCSLSTFIYSVPYYQKNFTIII